MGCVGSDKMSDQFIIHGDFQQWDVGSAYTLRMASEDFGDGGRASTSLRGSQRLKIAEEDQNKYLRVEYNPGQIGSANSGGSFSNFFTGGTDFILEYRV